MAIDNIDPNELSLQDAAGMQLVHVIRRIIEEINNGGDTPTPTPSEPTGIYYCTFDVTTKDEITAAIADELLPVCFHADKMHYLVAYQYGVYTFATISRDRGIISRIDCRVNGWSVQEPLEIQKVLTFDFTPTENSTNPVTSGGVYTAINNIQIDPQDIADAVDDWLDEHSSSIGGLTFEAKQALMNCFAHVAWIDANGQTYYDALYNALFNTSTLESIYALFTQGSAVIYDTDSLDSLRQYLVVTAYYSDETSAVVSDYTLSGTLTVGTSTITASYGGKSSTFNVTVSQSATLVSISTVFNQGSAIIYDTDSLDTLRQYLVVTATYSDQTTATITDYTLTGSLTTGISIITANYMNKTSSFSVTVSENTQPLYNWPNLGQSLVDSVDGKTATTNATQDSSNNCIYIDSSAKYINFGDIYAYDRTYIMEFGTSDAANISAHARFWCVSSSANTASNADVFAWKNGNGFAFYINSSWETTLLPGANAENRNRFGNSSLKIYVNNSGIATVYQGETLIGSSTHSLRQPASNLGIYIGGNSGDRLERLQIKSMIVYNGEV